KASRIPSERVDSVAASAADRYPISGIFFGCCASAATQSAKSTAERVRTVIFVFTFSAPFTRPPTLETLLFLFDHFIRPCKHFRWNSQVDLLSCLKVDDELKLRCLLHRQISRLGTFQDLVHVNSRTPVEVNVVCPVRHKTALIDKLLLRINSREPVLDSKLHDPFSFGEKAVTGGRHDRADLLLLYGFKSAL